MACSICHANTRLMAMARASSSFFEAVFLPEKIFQGGADVSGVDHG